MKKFNFRLQTALKYREILEDQAKNAYKEALGLLNISKQELIELESSKSNIVQQLDTDIRTGIHPHQRYLAETFYQQLIYLIYMKKQKISEQQKKAGQLLLIWEQKQKEAEAVRKLREKQYLLYVREIEKQEQNFLDDVFLAKKTREQAG
jgi:flagellar export protein FliJ